MAKPPPHVIAAARQAPAMRVPGSTVAHISYDSVLDDTDTPALERRITFTTAGLDVCLLVRPAGEHLDLVVETRPQAAATVRAFDGKRRPLDAAGTARLRVKRGMTSLVVEPTDPDAKVVQTAWVSL